MLMLVRAWAHTVGQGLVWLLCVALRVEKDCSPCGKREPADLLLSTLRVGSILLLVRCSLLARRSYSGCPATLQPLKGCGCFRLRGLGLCFDVTVCGFGLPIR